MDRGDNEGNPWWHSEINRLGGLGRAGIHGPVRFKGPGNDVQKLFSASRPLGGSS